ncbi:MAG: methionine--tRNA ligase subunit beta [Candidatus Pacebacteria bacterium]|nr:methionine--tRNA ligase subunit beta [Candidatus Paceibacterota bacterium]MDD4333536.1 methionine--tRNA ligase subunit beta [Candidatus Paceibacterota bacterium]
MENISFEEFKKIDLRMAKILSVEKVEDSNKLLKIEVDVGTEKRIVISGVAEFYKEEDLVGKEVIIVLNLEPKVIFGIESHGMLLFTKKEGRAIILTGEEEVAPGSIIS